MSWITGKMIEGPRSQCNNCVTYKLDFVLPLILGYKKYKGKWCSKWLLEKFSSRTDAQAACNLIPTCRAVYDMKCDDKEKFRLCNKGLRLRNSGPKKRSCVYLRGRNFLNYTFPLQLNLSLYNCTFNGLKIFMRHMFSLNSLRIVLE